MRNIDVIRQVADAAAGRWPDVLSLMGIDVPASPRAHVACPACGGKDRFRFDDDGRGAHFCNSCGAGDGLELVKKVNSCDATRAAQLVADALGIDVHTLHTIPGKDNSQLQQKQAERRAVLAQQQAQEQTAQSARFSSKLEALGAQAQPGECAYLSGKGLTGFTYPILPDGALLLVLENESGIAAAAQTITERGEKRLLIGSAKKGAYHVINPTQSPQMVIIGEGLATVLSVHLMRPDALAVVAIDAGNLLPVAQVMRQRYTQAQIVIAADNDIKSDEPNAGKDAAEKAATAITGLVALPPGDHKADWNDYHQQHGLANAIAAFNDSLYLPQGEKVTAPAEVIAIGFHANQKPNVQKPYVNLRHGGLYWIEPKYNKDTGETDEKETWLCDELATVGIGQDGRESYLVIRLRPEGSAAVMFEAVPRREVGQPAGWARLRSRGVNITTRKSLLDILGDYLQRHGERTQWTITQTAGWHCGAYVMPDGEIVGTPDMPVAFSGGTSAVAGYVVRGSAKQWRDNVAALMRGNQSMMLGALVAFAAPLNSLAGGSCFGIHLFAQSSAGKTTTVEAASSIYGVPDMLKLSWFTTAYGMTVEAASRNDGFLPIDEIGQGGDARQVSTSAYTLFNGVGKVQGAKEGGNRAVLRWTVAALSTGEEDFETFMLKSGLSPKAGQLVRLVSVPFVDTVEFNGMDDGDQHSRAIKREAARYCGSVGREWIALLAADKESAIRIVNAREEEWIGSLPEGASPQVKRVATRFALLDAAATLSAPLTGWSASECSTAVRQSFNDWLDSYGLGNREKHQVITRARDFIQRYGLSRFQPYATSKVNGNMDETHAQRILNLAGYLVDGRREDGRKEYHIIPSVFEAEILCGIQKKLGGEALEDVGMLVRKEKGRLDSRTISINGTQQRFVVLVDVEED
ncbi:DUF927 domain-containing protein [Superficieibacter sp. HKU1]|uniref:DUF927 domain-containing protein n=1 Tax=Superficieibacter sp. HKU1 TaxID=3031919 RepID=UPI0023E12260|nr:DUF927 domain-containing protein [Superficieibacter sp. HKU1]WES69660.1 DUF927 domain-containing protein [Superficieibacter sp. HKU1]